MAQLQTGIGTEQRKHTALRTKAAHYRRMALALQGGTVAQDRFPKYVPRGKPAAWYLAKATAFEQASETAGELAHLLHDLEQRTRWEAMTAEEAWERLITGRTSPGMTWRGQGLVEVFAWVLQQHLEEIHALVPKLSRAQREEAQGLIRALMTALLDAFQ